MLVGYARVSTEDQNLDLQRDALTKAGCERVFEDTASGARDDRPGLAAALSNCRAGDVLCVYKLDRLGRSTRGLLDLVAELREREIGFRSLSDSIDTTTPMGRFFFTIMAGLAEMERDLIRERTNAGLASARARGRKGGRKPKLTTQQICHARKLLADPETTIKDVAASLKVNRATIYRALGLGAAGRAGQKGDGL
jgi:DNA invertase Pin-like site-specific DNA recombinase